MQPSHWAQTLQWWPTSWPIYKAQAWAIAHELPEGKLGKLYLYAQPEDACWVCAGLRKAIHYSGKQPIRMHSKGKSSLLLQVCFVGRTCLGHNADGKPSAALASLAVPAQAGAAALHLGPAQWRLGEDW